MRPYRIAPIELGDSIMEQFIRMQFRSVSDILGWEFYTEHGIPFVGNSDDWDWIVATIDYERDNYPWGVSWANGRYVDLEWYGITINSAPETIARAIRDTVDGTLPSE